jgi:hypothetical protein
MNANWQRKMKDQDLDLIRIKVLFIEFLGIFQKGIVQP